MSKRELEFFCNTLIKKSFAQSLIGISAGNTN